MSDDINTSEFGSYTIKLIAYSCLIISVILLLVVVISWNNSEIKESEEDAFNEEDEDNITEPQLDNFLCEDKTSGFVYIVLTAITSIVSYVAYRYKVIRRPSIGFLPFISKKFDNFFDYGATPYFYPYRFRFDKRGRYVKEKFIPEAIDFDPKGLPKGFSKYDDVTSFNMELYLKRYPLNSDELKMVETTGVARIGEQYCIVRPVDDLSIMDLSELRNMLKSEEDKYMIVHIGNIREFLRDDGIRFRRDIIELIDENKEIINMYEPVIDTRKGLPSNLKSLCKQFRESESKDQRDEIAKALNASITNMIQQVITAYKNLIVLEARMGLRIMDINGFATQIENSCSATGCKEIVLNDSRRENNTAQIIKIYESSIDKYEEMLKNPIKDYDALQRYCGIKADEFNKIITVKNELDTSSLQELSRKQLNTINTSLSSAPIRVNKPEVKVEQPVKNIQSFKDANMIQPKYDKSLKQSAFIQKLQSFNKRINEVRSYIQSGYMNNKEVLDLYNEIQNEYNDLFGEYNNDQEYNEPSVNSILSQVKMYLKNLSELTNKLTSTVTNLNPSITTTNEMRQEEQEQEQKEQIMPSVDKLVTTANEIQEEEQTIPLVSSTIKGPEIGLVQPSVNSFSERRMSNKQPLTNFNSPLANTNEIIPEIDDTISNNTESSNDTSSYIQAGPIQNLKQYESNLLNIKNNLQQVSNTYQNISFMKEGEIKQLKSNYNQIGEFINEYKEKNPNNQSELDSIQEEYDQIGEKLDVIETTKNYIIQLDDIKRQINANNYNDMKQLVSSFENEINQMKDGTIKNGLIDNIKSITRILYEYSPERIEKKRKDQEEYNKNRPEIEAKEKVNNGKDKLAELQKRLNRISFNNGKSMEENKNELQSIEKNLQSIEGITQLNSDIDAIRANITSKYNDLQDAERESNLREEERKKEIQKKKAREEEYNRLLAQDALRKKKQEEEEFNKRFDDKPIQPQPTKAMKNLNPENTPPQNNGLFDGLRNWLLGEDTTATPPAAPSSINIEEEKRILSKLNQNLEAIEQNNYKDSNIATLYNVRSYVDKNSNKIRKDKLDDINSKIFEIEKTRKAQSAKKISNNQDSTSKIDTAEVNLISAIQDSLETIKNNDYNDTNSINLDDVIYVYNTNEKDIKSNDKKNEIEKLINDIQITRDAKKDELSTNQTTKSPSTSFSQAIKSIRPKTAAPSRIDTKKDELSSITSPIKPKPLLQSFSQVKWSNRSRTSTPSTTDQFTDISKISEPQEEPQEESPMLKNNNTKGFNYNKNPFNDKSVKVEESIEKVNTFLENGNYGDFYIDSMKIRDHYLNIINSKKMDRIDNLEKLKEILSGTTVKRDNWMS